MFFLYSITVLMYIHSTMLVTLLLVFWLVSLVNASCPAQYDRRPDTNLCYRHFGDGDKSAGAATDHCIQLAASHVGNASLVVIPDEETKNWIMSKYSTEITNDFWFGLFDRGIEDYIWADGSTFCKWGSPDGSCLAMPFNKFVAKIVHKKCVDLEDGLWEMEDCSEDQRFLCQYKRASSSEICPANYIAHPTTDFCYWITTSSGDKRTQQEAEDYCKNAVAGLNGTLGHLVKITSQDLYTWIIDVLITSAYIDKDFWFGLYTTDDIHYRWTETPDDIYTRMNGFWKSGKPNSESQKCNRMGIDGTWDDKPCSETKPYMCQYKIPETGTAFLLSDPDECGDNLSPATLNRAWQTNYLWDRNSSTCVTPFMNSTDFQLTIVVYMYNVWRTRIVVAIQGDNLPRPGADSPLVYLNKNCDGCDDTKQFCVPYSYEPVSSHLHGSSFYYCNEVANEEVKYIVIQLRNKSSDLRVCEVILL